MCYFFFQDNEEQNSTATAACALLHQIFCNQKGLFQKFAETLIKEYGKRLTLDFDAPWQLWISTASEAPTREVICIIDALDECQRQDREALLRKLELFYVTLLKRQTPGPNFKFIITSRPQDDINRIIRRLSNRYSAVHLAGEVE